MKNIIMNKSAGQKSFSNKINEQKLSQEKTPIKNKPNAYIALGLSTF